VENGSSRSSSYGYGANRVIVHSHWFASACSITPSRAAHSHSAAAGSRARSARAIASAASWVTSTGSSRTAIKYGSRCTVPLPIGTSPPGTNA
jgi:hypothetical protein